MTHSTGLMAGKTGLIMGVANDRSLAWGIARLLSRHGAELAFTYQNEVFLKRVELLAESVGSSVILPCDVSDERNIDSVFAKLMEKWNNLDFVVHAIAYSDREGLKGKYLNTTKQNFAQTLEISCYSFTAVAKRAVAMMDAGGSLLTLTYSGSERVMPDYNVMGVAKAALEASVRYLAADLGREGIRVNAISAGPMRTLAGSGIASARYILKWHHDNAPLRRDVQLDEVGSAALYLLSDLSSAVTGEVHHVDCGYNIMGMKLVDVQVPKDVARIPEELPGLAAAPAVASPKAAAEGESRRVSEARPTTVDQARNAYDDTVQQARKAYDEMVKRARKAYDDRVQQARGGYDEVVKHAREAGEAAMDRIRTIVGEPDLDRVLRAADRKATYSYEDLLECARGHLFGPGNAQLPLPPLLMFDRIVTISEQEGKYGKGEVVAELDVTPNLWFFDLHFETDPVMPGCLGVDAMWQLVGFYLGWLGAPGRGRALRVGEVKFTGQVLPTAKKVSYHVSMKRVILRKLVLGIADGVMKVDGQPIYEARDLRVGLFTSTEDF